MSIPWTELGTVCAMNFAIAMAAVLLLWLASIPLRDVSIIDMFFALILLAIAAASYAVGGGFDDRKALILILVSIWAVRITIYLMRRNWGHGEDVRYTKLRNWVDGDRAFYWLSLRKVFLLQGIILWFVSLPVQFAMITPEPQELGWGAYAGTGLWVVGFLFEVVGDWQLTQHRNDPSRSHQVLSTGLWRYSRHPNYFGEICLWWGLFLIACDNPWAWLTFVGPALYAWLIINVTGKATLEKKMRRERPGYAAYVESTSGLIPWPPRQSPFS